jgi:2,4-dichlorophenol 6-monooxygenase
MAYETDVLIIGAGPDRLDDCPGARNSGVRCHIVSRGNWMADSPRAHITNQRANEVFRDLGISEDVARYASPWELMGDTMFTTSLAGPELIRMRTWGTGDDRRGDYLRASPCGMVDIIQPLLEPILFQKAAEKGATFAFNTEYVRHEQDSDGVTATLRDRLDGREFTDPGAVHGRRRRREIVSGRAPRASHRGSHGAAGTVYTVFNADLSRYSKHRPSILNWIVTPDASFGEIGMGLLRAVRPWTQWIAGWGFDINKGDPDLSESNVREKIRVLIGIRRSNLISSRTSVWYINQAYVTQYSKGRVFCGGDAVHRHPPSSGLGKQHLRAGRPQSRLEARLRSSRAGPARSFWRAIRRNGRPSESRIVQRANQSRLDYAPAERLFPCTGRRESGSGGHRAVPLIRSEGVVPAESAQAALDLKQTEYNAQGVEMNQRYESSAVIPDRGPKPEIWRRDRDLYNQPTTRPGAKIPHAWLVGPDGTRMSTLDVTGKGLFTVVTGLAGTAWRTRCAASIFRSCGSS